MFFVLLKIRIHLYQLFKPHYSLIIYFFKCESLLTFSNLRWLKVKDNKFNKLIQFCAEHITVKSAYKELIGTIKNVPYNWSSL